ncbi:MAG: hypothetical protein M1825_002303 [Sarcosagium campestre]|nr:MAG: hypothetical protein M1825_002303 [Sarcosagium campestre]
MQSTSRGIRVLARRDIASRCLLCRHLSYSPRLQAPLSQATTSSSWPPSYAHRIARTASTSTSPSPTPHAQPPQRDTNLPGRDQTYYDLFPSTLPQGPPPRGPFAIPLPKLKREFLQLQSLAHPDRQHSSGISGGSGGGGGRAQEEGLSARINEAYRILEQPLTRAQYLLSLRGIDVAADETGTVEDAQLLMQVMDVREAVEAAESEAEVEELRRENEVRVAESVSVLEDAFARDDLVEATDEAVRLRYWTNIKESLNDWEAGKPVVLQH